VAAVGGTVVYAGYRGGGFGYAVAIRDDYGNTWAYAHITEDSSRVGLQPGQRVNAGTLIAYVGQTGNAEGPHLHLSINETSASTNSTLYDAYDLLTDPSAIYKPAGWKPPGAGSASPDQGSGGGGGNNDSSGAASSGEPIVLATGYKKYTVGGVTYLVYELAGTGGASVPVYYKLTGVSAPGSATSMSVTDWKAMTKGSGWVNGGSTEAFRGVEPGTSWKSMVDRFLYETGLKGSDALNDQGVLRVLAQYISRPDMSPEEFGNRLRNTRWWRQHTDTQRAWNDLSPAEQQQRTIDAAGKLTQIWFTYVGEEINWGSYDTNKDGVVSTKELQAGNNQLYKWAQRLASGEITEVQAIESWVKGEARKNENSPWARIVRDEAKQAGQHEVDVETAAAQVVDLYESYGIRIGWKKAQEIGEQLVMNEQSIAEVEMGVDKQASALYPGKPKGSTVVDWAQPYLLTYQQLLETADPGLFNGKVQRALKDNQSLADFSTVLRKDPRWEQTANAREEYANTAAELGRQMGFV